jgi:2,3-bisphosphoglycerate-independent phosphoglycerate mutase
MRSLMIIIDGLGDDPIPAWNGQTPFTRARHPYLDGLAQRGTLSEVCICDRDLKPESLSCILRLLGIPKKNHPVNRAYLELLAQGRDISEYEMVLRCNIVSLDKAGRMVSFNGMGLTAVEKKELAAAHNHILSEIEFMHLSDYRNLLILPYDKKVLGTYTAPPHESMGLQVSTLLEELTASSLELKHFLHESEKILKPYRRAGLNYALYPWGPSARTVLPKFADVNGQQGALVGKAEIVTGIGKALQMVVPEIPEATGDTDTNISAKLQATLAMLQDNPFVVTHFNGADEASHRHDYEGKVAFLERIDKEFLGPLLETLTEPIKILICGDHVTSSVTGKHTDGMVPVIAAYTNKQSKITLNNYEDILNFSVKAGN